MARRQKAQMFAEITRNRRFHRSPKRVLKALRVMHADDLTDQRETFRNERRQAHFFPADKSTSLCGRWGFQFVAAGREPDHGKPSKDDCAACRRKLEASS